MATIAKVWEGSVDDLDGCYHKIIDLMECVHNLDGNYCENEVLQVAKVLQDFTINDMDEVDRLNIDIIDDDDEDYDDTDDEVHISERELTPYANRDLDELLSMLENGLGRE